VAGRADPGAPAAVRKRSQHRVDEAALTMRAIFGLNRAGLHNESWVGDQPAIPSRFAPNDPKRLVTILLLAERERRVCDLGGSSVVG
jgi:hypothetical protein